MTQGNEVICAGILVADHVCTPMDTLPGEGRLVAVGGMSLHTGGCAANVAINIARQGIRVGAVGRVGNDYWGRFVREDLAAREVDTGCVTVSEREQTSQTMVLLVKGQDRRFVHCFGANAEFSAADVPPDCFASARVLYLGGYLLMPGLEAEGLGALFQQCRSRGVRTVLDVVVPAGLDCRGVLEPVLPYTDIFMPNDDEAAALTGEREPLRQAAALRSLGAKTVVITQGGDGLLVAHDAGIWHVSPFPTPAVDPTGAGDAFCAGFIAGMVRGTDLEGCLQYGSALGASCVRSIGACDGVMDAEQARRFLEQHRLRIEAIAA